MPSDKAVKAARRADWSQVVGNGGPPCFALMEDGDFCLRAERWPGHEPHHDHSFVSLAALLDEFAADEREACNAPLNPDMGPEDESNPIRALAQIARQAHEVDAFHEWFTDEDADGLNVRAFIAAAIRARKGE